jgi:putative DNA primase/helicase
MPKIREVFSLIENTVHDAGRNYLESGLSVIPVRADGTKAPAIPTWKEYQTRQFTDAEWEETNHSMECIAMLGGSISGNLEILDFDDPTAFPLWRELVEQYQPGILAGLPIAKTPTGGFHVYYRTNSPIEGNRKLAQKLDRDGKPDVIAETRGEGGYVLAPPSSGKCHPSGNGYELIEGDISSIPSIGKLERKLLVEVASPDNS